MNFLFEFLNFHISHLTQLGMINITLKCQKKTYLKKFTIFTTIDIAFGSYFCTHTLTPNIEKLPP
jgi:hypothetical protein